MDRVERETLGQIKQLSPHAFGYILDGLVRFGHPISKVWIEEAIAYFEENFSRFRTSSLCYATAALVKSVMLVMAVHLISFQVRIQTSDAHHHRMLFDDCQGSLILKARYHCSLPTGMWAMWL